MPEWRHGQRITRGIGEEQTKLSSDTLKVVTGKDKVVTSRDEQMEHDKTSVLKKRSQKHRTAKTLSGNFLLSRNKNTGIRWVNYLLTLSTTVRPSISQNFLTATKARKTKMDTLLDMCIHYD